MTLLPYLVVAGILTLVVGFVWVSCVWLPGVFRREQIDPLEDQESVDACATTGRFRRLDVEDVELT